MNKEQNEITRLLEELKSMTSVNAEKHISNNRDVWSKIGAKDIEAAGFENEAEMIQWLENNEYQNMS